MFKRKLFKRALPMILSVAMVFQSVPATAMAAEYEETETVVEQTTANDTENQAESEAENQNENQPEEENQSAENTVESDTENSTDTVATAEKTTDVETADANVTVEAIDAEEVQNDLDNTDTDTVEAEITIRRLYGDDDVTVTTNSDDEYVAAAVYKQKTENLFSSFVSDLKNYYISASAQDGTSLTNNLVYTWEKGTENEDGTYSYEKVSEAPSAAGTYRLVISIDESLNVSYETKYIHFIIEKAVLTVGTDADTSNLSGKTVSEIKTLLAEELTISTNNNETAGIDYLEYLSAKDTSIFNIRKAGDEAKTALEDSYKLKKGDDIVVETNAVLKDSFKDNYELEQFSANVSVTELKPVSIEPTTPKLEAGDNITYTYTGSEITDPTIGYSEADTTSDIIVTVISDDEVDETTGEAKTLSVTADNITTSWFDANKTELGENVLPKDAGVYYYQLTYTDLEGIYAEATAEVKVVIEPVKLVVRPTLSEDEKTYNVGSSVKELLNNVAPALYTLGEDGTTYSDFTIPTGEENTFWGVSYNQDDIPQYYEPVFKVQMRTNTTIKDADGKETTTEGSWTDVTGTLENSTKPVSETDEETKITTTTAVEYRVVFAGQKAVYINGNVIDKTVVDINKQIDVNSADTNYDVYTTDNVVGAAANVIGITVNDSTVVTIDTSDIVSGLTAVSSVDDIKLADDVKNVYNKIYDGSAFFADRSAYKKAKTSNSEADNAENFSYTWYKWSSADMEPKQDDKGEIVKDADGNILYVPVCGSRTVSTSYDLHELSDAGKYCLKITYKDPTNTYTAEPAYLFFNVEQQLVKIEPKAENLTAYTSNTVIDFIEKILNTETTDYRILSVKDNNITSGETTDLTEEWNRLDDEQEEGFYAIDWVVLKGDNADKDKAVYTEINNYYDNFELNIPYKLGAKLVWVNDDNYTNEYDCGENNPIQSEYYYSTLDITVNESANKALEVVFDETKLDKTEKTYNGEAQFDVNKLIESGYITLKVSGTDEVVSLTGENALPVVFTWENDEYDEKTTNDVGLVNAGTYSLVVSYSGDATYGGVYERADYDFVIKPAKLIVDVTPALQSDKIVAGLDMSQTDRYDGDVASLVNGNYDAVTVTGYIEADKAAFEGGIYSDVFYNWFYPVVSDSEGKIYNGYLRYQDSYTLSLEFYWRNDAGDDLKDGYTENYELDVKGADFTVGKRGTSSVEYAESDNYGMSVKADYTQSPITVVPVDGVHYFYEDDLGIGEEFVSGNYFVFDIAAPKEFMEDSGSYAKYYKNFVYQNSIESDEGKGYVIRKAGTNGTIRVAFPVTEDDKTAERTFTIVWEELDGEIYKETFKVDFSSAQLEDDLRSAVAPKSLAFNGVNTKMTVGETQQLDVKLTKVLNSDVVYLNYEVTSGSDVISVTKEAGVVTALKKGSATVAVYPVKRNEKGAFEKLDFKAVTTKITVSDVTAPKINSVYAYDYKFDITYTKPSDGYRREIYVLEGKNLKSDAFETAIENAKKGNTYSETFAAYKLLSKADEAEYYNSNTNTVSLTIGGNSKIEPNKDYTVYVRNVSGTRTLDDNSFVELSGLGTTKAFKTTAIQPLDISLYYDSEQEAAKLTAEEEKLDPDGCDEIDLAKGSIQLQAMGLYHSSAEGADYSVDYEWKKLPIDKKDSAYAAQKLSFYALDSTEGYTKEQLAINKDLSKTYKVLIGDRYYKASSIAKIDKNGKLTLTGIGYVYICAYDSVSKKLAWFSYGDTLEVSGDDMYVLRITTSIKNIQAKSITLKAGSVTSIYNSLTFLGGEKNKKLASNLTSQVGIMVESDNDAVWYEKGYVVAEKPDQTANLTVMLEDNPEIKTTLQVKTKAMDAVKSLKASDVIDHKATVTFSHTSNWPDAFNFKIELSDNRNRLISSEIIDSWDMIDWEKFDSKNYWYTYEFNNLKRQSVYNVTVTPIYNDGTEAAKPAKTKFTTTNIPASEENLAKDEYGGMWIRVDGTNNYGDKYLHDIGYLTSGNTYTLIAEADETAKNRKTDTLTWKSSNSKVASIKANAGTFTAALKATGVGATTIEVTSKLTKKVIARYIVRVKSVSNGGPNAYGDTEPKEQVYWDEDYDFGIEVLTEANPVVFDATAYDYRWVSFTAPADGKYYFGRSNAFFEGYYYNHSYTNGSISSVVLNEGETIYIKVSGNSSKQIKTVTVKIVSSEKYGKLTTSSSVNAADYAQVTFTAPSDNYYTFYASEAGKSATKSGVNTGKLYFATENDEVNAGNSVGLRKGQKLTLINLSNGSYEISVKGRAYTTLGNEATNTGDLKKGDEKWYSFEASAEGWYTISLGDTNEKVLAEYYTGLTNANGTSIVDNSVKLALSKGDKIAIRVYTESEEAVSTTISVSQPEVIAFSNNTAKVKLPKNGEAWLSFDIDEAAAEYCFSYDKEVTADYYLNSVTDWTYVTNNIYHSNKGDKTLYIKLTSTAAEDIEVTATVTKTVATELTAGTASGEVKVTTDSKTFYQFTAPEYGLYTFTGTAKAAEGSTAKKITAKEYEKAQQTGYSSYFAGTTTNGFYAEKMFAAGEKLIFSVESTDETGADTTASVIVAKVDVSALSGEEISLAAGESRWFKYTAAEKDDYKFSWNTDTTANVFYSAELRANISSGLANGDVQTLEAGNTLYLKITNSASEATKLKLTVASAAAPLPEGEFEVKANESVTYKYTVTEAGRYNISYTGAAEDTNVRISYSDSRSRVSGTVLAAGTEIVFDTVGKTIRFTVETDKDVKLTIKLEKIVPSEAGEASVEKGKAQWFKVTIPATGRYTVAVTDKDGKALENAEVEYVTDMLLSYSDDLSVLNENWLEKDAVYYVRVKNNAEAAQSVMVAFNKIDAEAITLGTPVEVTLKEGEVKYYSFKTTEKGVYTHTIENESGATLEYFDGTSNDSYSLTTGTVKVPNGIDELIKITGAGEGAAVKLTINKGIELTLEAGKDLQVTLADEANAYIAFTAPKAGWYAFYLKDIPEGTDANAYDDNDIALDNSAVYGYTRLKLNEERSFGLTVNFTPASEGETRTVTLCAEEIAPSELTSELPVSVAKGVYQWVTFTAPEDGRYVFDDDSTAVKAQYRYTGTSIRNGGSTGYLPYEKNLEKDEKITLAVYYNDKADTAEGEIPASAEFKLSVKEIVPIAIDSTKETSELTIPANATAWYSYTAAKNGSYQFTFKEGENSFKAYLYRSMADANHNGYSSSFNSVMTVNDSVYFKLSNKTDAEKTITFEAFSNEIETLKEGDAGNTINFTEAGGKYILFKPSQTHNHKITVKYTYEDINAIRWYTRDTNGGYTNLRVLSKNQSSMQMNLDASEKYYLYVDSNKATTVQAIVVSCDKEYDVSLGDGSYDGSLDMGEVVYYKLTADYAGDYSFFIAYADADILDSSKNSLNLKDEDSSNNYSRYTYHLKKDEAVYIKVYRANGAAVDWYYINIALESMDAATNLEEEAEYSIAYGETKWFSFQPLESGLYRLGVKRNDGENDYWEMDGVGVYDNRMYSVDWSDSGNFSFSAHSIYYINVESYDENTVFKLFKDTSIEKVEIGETVNAAAGKERYVYQLTPSETEYYTFAFNGIKNLYVYLYDENNYPYEDCQELEVNEAGICEGIMYDYYIYYLVIETDGETPFSFKISCNNTEKLLEGNPVSASVKSEARKRYCFTPAVTGLYTFSFSGIEKDVWLYAYITNQGEDGYHEISGESPKFIHKLYKGNKYFLSVTNENSSNADFTLEVAGMDFSSAETIMAGSEVLTELAAGEYAVYRFSAPKAGIYSFYSTTDENWSGSSDSYGYLYDKDFDLITENDDDNGGGNFGIKYTMTAGETVYLVVKQYSFGAINCYVHVTEGDYSAQ